MNATAASDEITGSDDAGRLLRRQDEDRWLSAQYAPAPQRIRLFALYRLNAELNRVAISVSEPLLGEMKLQWYRDAIGEIRSGAPPRRHPAILAGAAAGLFDLSMAELVDARIDAAAAALYPETCTNREALEGWARAGEGAIDAIACRMLGGTDALTDSVQRLGAARVLARGMIKPFQLDAEIARDAAANIWRRERDNILGFSKDLAPAVAHLFLTPLYLRKSETPFPLGKRLRIARAVMTGR